MYNFEAIINNEFITTEKKVEIINPDGLKVIGTVSALNGEQINAAFQAARKAQKSWEQQTLSQRITILQNWAKIIEQNQEQIAQVMMEEIGKGYKDALTEVVRTLEYMQTTFDLAQQMVDNPLIYDLPALKKHATFDRVAKGVGLAIAPFNYPFNLAMSKIAPALVMGNTIVFKPATNGSLVGSLLGKLAVVANLPAGIFNVVTGRGREIGDIISQNPEIDFISFTGSVEVGHHLMKISSSKDLVLELGGKDPAIILDNTNLDKVANEIVNGGLSYSGQRCTAIKRVLTTNAIADELGPILKAKIEALTVGHPVDNAFITPIIDMKAADFVWDLIQDAKKAGATIITGDKKEANLIYPTLVDHVTVDMKLAWEEPFGPVIPIIRLDSVEEMIKVANASDFGLQASIFSSDIDLALKVAKQIEVGTININSKSQRGPDIFPFLGIKNSGHGVQGIEQTLLSVTRYRGIVINK